jgi:hypothetical protein
LPAGEVLLRCALGIALVAAAVAIAAELDLEPGSSARLSVVALGVGLAVALVVWRDWAREDRRLGEERSE